MRTRHHGPQVIARNLRYVTPVLEIAVAFSCPGTHVIAMSFLDYPSISLAVKDDRITRSEAALYSDLLALVVLRGECSIRPAEAGSAISSGQTRNPG